MAEDSWKLKKSLNIEPRTSPTLDSSGDIGVNSSDNELKVYLDGSTRGVVTKDQTQTLTNKTLTAPAISTISNTGTLTLPTSTDTLVGRATTDTLTNKTLTAPTIDVATFDGQGSTPSSPSAGNYKVYVDDTTSKLQILDSSGTVTAIGSGAGGSLNYIENPDAEAATTGWAAYADAAGTSPVDGTGGSPTLTFTRTTSSPLRGLASFLITKDAANRQGEGASYNFDIDSADGGKMMQITFDYAIASGTYATGDLAVYVIHDPNGTPKIIQPSGYQIENVGVNSVARLTFQTEVSAQLDYTLCFHVASTSASAYTVKLDNVQLGPQVVPLGAPVTDWVSYNLTIGAATTPPTQGSGASKNAQWRRVGDSMEIIFEYLQTNAGTAGSGVYYFPLPSGYTIDTAKLTQLNGGASSVGSCLAFNGSIIMAGSVRAINSTNLTLYMGDATNATSEMASTFFPLSNTSQRVGFTARVPIVGWSSSTVVSSSADTRVVVARYTTATAGSYGTGGAILDFTTKVIDTHGAVTTGASWKFTAPVPGNYRVGTGLSPGGTNGLYAVVGKNGADYARVAQVRSGSGAPEINGSTIVALNAGDYVQIAVYSETATTSLTANAVLNYVDIELIQGPSQIAASEVVSLVAARTGSNQAIATSAATTLIWNSATKDSHGMLNTSTGVVTVPAPGDYSVQALTYFTGCAAEVFTISIRKNSTIVASYFATATTDVCFPIAYTIPNCVAGDTIDVVMDSAADTSYSLVLGDYTKLSIHRLGGVM